MSTRSVKHRYRVTPVLARGLAVALAGLLAAAAVAYASSPRSSASLPSKVTIGALLPLAGPDAYFGQDASAGAQIAVNDINAAGGVDRKIKLSLKVVDNQSGTTPGNVAAIGNLISTANNLGMVFGYGASANVALKPYFEQHHLIGINAGSNDSQLSALTPDWFNLAVLSPIEMHAFSEYLYHVKHFKTAGIIGQDDDIGQGQDWEKEFSQQFKLVGGKIVGESMGSESATTFQSEVSSVKSDNPQVVFIAAGQTAVPTIMSEVRSVGWNVQMTTDSNFAGDAAVLTAPSAQGLLSSGYEFTAPASFSAEYTKIVGKAAGPPYSAVGNYYDGVEIYAQGLSYAIKHHMGITGPDVAAAIRKIGTFKILDGVVTINAKGNVSRPVAVYKISNGVDVPVVANALKAAGVS